MKKWLIVFLVFLCGCARYIPIKTTNGTPIKFTDSYGVSHGDIYLKYKEPKRIKELLIYPSPKPVSGADIKEDVAYGDLPDPNDLT